jgi:hypothetical protein
MILIRKDMACQAGWQCRVAVSKPMLLFLVVVLEQESQPHPDSIDYPLRRNYFNFRSGLGLGETPFSGE